MACVAPSAFGEGRKAGDLSFEPFSLKVSGGGEVEAELGRLAVPENRGNPDSNLIDIAFLRLKSTATEPGTPVFYLVGGPGGSGVAAARGARFALFDKLRAIGDVILMDQRGVGLSRPSLVCNEHRADMPLEGMLTREIAAEAYRKVARTCFDHFTQDGIDLAAYNTEENADDIDDLRRALGAEKICLAGSSYGTHLGFAYIRRYGEHVHRAALAGIEGPDHTLKLPSTLDRHLRKVAEFSNQDPGVREAVPDLEAVVRRVMARVEADPPRVSMRDLETREMVEVVVGKFDVQRNAGGAVGRVRSMRGMPGIFAAMDRGDFRYLARQSMGLRRSGVGSMMSVMMDCSSGISPARAERIRRENESSLIGDAMNFPFFDISSAVGDPDLGDDFRASLHSEIPVLFISGTLDGRTPLENAREVAEGFSNAEHMTIVNAGHDEELFSGAPGLKESIVSFLRGERLAMDRIELPAPKFSPVTRRE